ncbi:MAG: hypothetical protein KIT80_21390 [Chitinophagaceae bacterium]|nr:hypothetical protein [Chitinophagaceae bacterium]MCW5929489.1 hypothetical protein [Chitinophagaceae bacterium]
MGLRVFCASILYSLFLNFFVLSNKTVKQEYYLLTLSITTIFEFFLFSYLFFRILQSKQTLKLLYLVTAIVGVYLFYEISTNPITSYDPVPSIISFLIILIYCIIYLFERVKDPNDPFFYFTTTFWVVVALIMYCAGTFFALMYGKAYLQESAAQNEYDFIHDSLYIIKNIILIIAIFSSESGNLKTGRNLKFK